MTTLRQTTSPSIENDVHTLVGEHARLMRDVTRRAAPVSALLGAGAWPHAELGSLTDLLHSAVLRQVSDEEVHLFPHDSSAPPFAELSADHARLHYLTARLDEAYARPCPRAQLRALVDDLLDTLRRHLEGEQKVLVALSATAGEVPSVADVLAGTQPWLIAGEAPIRIDVDKLPGEQAAELCLERLLRLRPRQTAEVRSCDERLLRTVCRWLHNFDASRFGFSKPTAESGQYLLRVTCRQ